MKDKIIAVKPCVLEVAALFGGHQYPAPMFHPTWIAYHITKREQAEKFANLNGSVFYDIPQPIPA